MKIFLIIFFSIMILPVFAPSHPEYTGFDPPRKQIAYGVLPENVNCKEGLVLFIKYNGSPACVKPETSLILEQRGWGEMPSNFSIDSFEDCIAAGNPAMESYPRQCRTSDGKHFVESIVPDYALACQSNGGQWLAELKECELFESHEFCEELGGVYNECASACRNAPDYPNLACIDVCVEVCSFR